MRQIDVFRFRSTVDTIQMAGVDEMSLLTGAVDLDSIPDLRQTEAKVYICSTATGRNNSFSH